MSEKTAERKKQSPGEQILKIGTSVLALAFGLRFLGNIFHGPKH